MSKLLLLFVLAIPPQAPPLEAELCPCGCRAGGPCTCYDCAQRTGVPCSCGCMVTGKCQCKNCNDRLWFDSYDAGVAQAEAEGKDLLLDFRNAQCVFCDQMDRTTFATLAPELRKKYVLVKIHEETYPQAASLFGVTKYPAVVVVQRRPWGIRQQQSGYLDAPSLLKWLAPKGRAPVGHTHTCAHGHTWDHTVTGSHSCPVCGMTVYRIDQQPRPVNTQKSAAWASYTPTMWNAAQPCVGSH